MKKSEFQKLILDNQFNFWRFDLMDASNSCGATWTVVVVWWKQKLPGAHTQYSWIKRVKDWQGSERAQNELKKYERWFTEAVSSSTTQPILKMKP